MRANVNFRDGWHHLQRPAVPCPEVMHLFVLRATRRRESPSTTGTGQRPTGGLSIAWQGECMVLFVFRGAGSRSLGCLASDFTVLKTLEQTPAWLRCKPTSYRAHSRPS